MFIATRQTGGQTGMRTKNFTRILGGLILGLSLLGIGAMSSTTAQAQYPWNQTQRERERERQRELRRQREQQERQGGWYDQYGNYHAANTQNGYYDQNGVFHPYSNQNGYYNRSGNYNGRYSGRYNDGYPDLGGSFDLRQTALNAGFTDGVKAGREDLRRNRGSNYQSHSEYQKATRDYNSGRGDRYLYQQYYRMAFEHGYADGITGH
jgi:hypothetical protein